MEGPSLLQRFQASMVIAGVGDAMGYYNGHWEFSLSGLKIHEEMNEKGGIAKLNISPPWFPVSDDTVMLIASAEAMIAVDKEQKGSKEYNQEIVVKNFIKEYLDCRDDFGGRAPGPTTLMSLAKLSKGLHWSKIEYNPRGGGCGGSMRSMCIGLRYANEKPEEKRADEKWDRSKIKRFKLTSTSIESGRLTHNNPIGFLGSYISALFTAYAIEGVEPVLWGQKLIDEDFESCMEYLRNHHQWEDYESDVANFFKKFKDYFALRKIYVEKYDYNSPLPIPQFPERYGVAERDEFYQSIAFEQRWGGSSGDDSCIIAYDALLGSKGDYEEFVKRGVLHGGDNDSTGCIGGAWFGAFYGMKGVPECNFKHLEKRKELEELGQRLFELYERDQH
eukprot:TRINITY_DN3274_c0_g2_i1.p1 TRINITY_DN3274_c0_g2~~TRINITY_DN3274_c0_g2_i1.p1  ORF type:complete len:390 (-),score=88.84 TRINITY_DN3274_c0_g2_i1:110-1279(-)